MVHPLRKGILMTNKELAQAIRDRFTPLVFKCECNGNDPDCRRIMDENIGGVWQRFDAVHDITKWLESQND